MKPNTPIPTPVAGELVHKLPLADCLISEINTRQPKPADVQGLALSVKEFGQTTPGIVRPHPKQPGKYEIGAGSRRRVSCEVAGLPTFDAVIRQLNDDDFEELVVIENSNHEDPDPRAEVRLLERIVKRGVRTAEAISAHLGKPKHWVERRLKLLAVIPEIRELWEKPNKRNWPQFDHFTVEMMELVGSLPVETQKLFLHEEQHTPGNVETRAELHQAIERRLMCRLDQATFDLNDPATFVEACGPGCATDTSKQGALFDLGDKCGRCTNAKCFFARTAKARANELAAIEKEHGDKLQLVTAKGSGRITIGDKPADPRYVGRASDKPTKELTEKAIVLNDKGQLALGYIAKAAAPTQSANGSSSNGSGGAKPQKKSLQEKKDALQARRWKVVHEDLEKALKESKHTACNENIEDLVACFGLPFHAQSHERSHKGGTGNKRWAIFDDRKTKGFPLHDHSQLGESLHKQRAAALWSGLKDVLRQTMLGWFNVGDIGKAVPDMQRVAKLIGYPLEQKKREVDLTIKVPSTWGGAFDVHTLEPISTKQPDLPKPGVDFAKFPKGNDAACRAAGMKRVKGNRPTRAKLKAAAKARWSKKKPTKLSAASRAKLAAAMKARWEARRAKATRPVRTRAKN